MSMSVKRNHDNSYTVTCGTESVTVGGDDGGGGGRPGADDPRGTSGGGGDDWITPTEGGVDAAIISSERDQPFELRPYKGVGIAMDPALWLRIEIAKRTMNPGALKKRPVVLGWQGYGKMDLADLAVEMEKMGLADAPIEIRAMPPKAAT